MSTKQAFYKHPEAWSVGLLFFFLNVCFGSWLSRLPEVQRSLALSESSLGLILLGMPLGAMLSTTLSRYLLAKLQPGRLGLLSILAFVGAMVGPPLAQTGWSLGMFLFIAGLVDGLVNVSINTSASSVESHWSVKVMSSCHGMFSLGGFVGALIGGLSANFGLPLYIQMGMIFILALLVLGSRFKSLWYLPSNVSQERQPMRWPSLQLVAFMLIGICIMIGEGAISDWSAIYLSKSLHANPFLAALGFAGFSAAMAVGRFGGDRIRELFPPRKILRNGTLVAVAGLLIAVSFPYPGAAILGFTMAGLGYATGVPILFLEAGNLTPQNPGIGIAAVANAGLIGFLGAPPAIGFIAEHLGLPTAMFIVAMLALAAAIGSHFSLSK